MSQNLFSHYWSSLRNVLCVLDTRPSSVSTCSAHLLLEVSTCYRNSLCIFLFLTGWWGLQTELVIIHPWTPRHLLLDTELSALAGPQGPFITWPLVRAQLYSDFPAGPTQHAHSHLRASASPVCLSWDTFCLLKSYLRLSSSFNSSWKPSWTVPNPSDPCFWMCPLPKLSTLNYLSVLISFLCLFFLHLQTRLIFLRAG